MGRRLEVCVDDAAGLKTAVNAGADRIELCSALLLGGLTPSPGLMAIAAEASVPVFAMVRPRPGNFVYGLDDLRQMVADIEAIRAFGLAGMVIGANAEDGTLDRFTLSRLIEAADGLPAVLHRAIDLTPDPVAAVDVAVDLGFSRILTSGGKPTAIEGRHTIAAMQAQAAGRIEILPGSGLTPENVYLLLESVADVDVHASCSIPRVEPAARASAQSFDVPGCRQTDADLVRAMKAQIARSPG